MALCCYRENYAKTNNINVLWYNKPKPIAFNTLFMWKFLFYSLNIKWNFLSKAPGYVIMNTFIAVGCIHIHIYLYIKSIMLLLLQCDPHFMNCIACAFTSCLLNIEKRLRGLSGQSTACICAFSLHCPPRSAL